MIARKSGSSQLLAVRAPESAQTALRGESARPEVTQPSALNQPMALLPTQPPPSRTQHFRLDAGEAEGQMVPYGGGGPPDPEAGYSLVAPVRDFVSRQYNSLMEAFPSRPRNAMERRARETAALADAIPVPLDPEFDGPPLALGNGQPALPPPIGQNAPPAALEGGQAALEGGQPAPGPVRTQAASPPPILNREMVPLPAAPPPQTMGATRSALPPPPRQIRDHGPAFAGPARREESPMIVQLREPEKIPEPVNVMPSFMKWMPGSQPKAMMPGERGRSPPPDHVANLTRMAGNVLGAGLRGAAKGVTDYVAPAAYEVGKFAATKALEGGSAAIQNHLIPGVAGGSDWAYRALTSANASSTRYMLEKLDEALGALVDDNRDTGLHQQPALIARGRVISPAPSKQRSRSTRALPAPEPSVDSRNYKGHRDRSPQAYAGAVPQAARHAEVMQRSEESLKRELSQRPEVQEVVKKFPGVSVRDWLDKLDKKKLAMMAVRLNM